jgi:hypothetical protein
MTEPAQPAQPAPAQQASPPAAAAPAAAAPAAEPAPDGLTAAEESELGRLLAKRDAALDAEAIRLKVEPPHSELTHGGVTVTSEFTSVPAGRAAAILTAADEAGVKITQES